MVRSTLQLSIPSLFALALALSSAACGDGGGEKGGSAGADASGGNGGSGGSGGSSTGGTGGQAGAASTGGSTMEVALGDIAFNVIYTGTQTGTLSLAAVTSFPPQGPPSAYQSFPMPMFPQAGKLVGLESDKKYYVAAVLDIGDNNPQSPGPEDLVAFIPMAQEIVPNGEISVELTLMDK
ncbi:MAG: hypothetical protein IPK82_37125 [Polyangiaceae bacterium]|nr:hypothetical protein [Polyangiaceae bacterium]